MSNSWRKFTLGVRQLFKKKTLFLQKLIYWELAKFFESSNDYQSYQSGIETIENTWTPVLEFLPIVPIWNWNCSKYDDKNRGSVLPIVPIWNWNVNSNCGIKCGSIYQSYQSGIETVGRPSSEYRSGLPIVPIWNWNLITSLSFSRRGIYQSYQSGIETWLSK